MSRRKSSDVQDQVAKTSESSNSPKPSLSFKEEEVSQVVDFLNVVAKQARFSNLTIEDMARVTKLYKNMVNHAKVCEAHIMELKQVIEKP